jgi:hypothetical protein
MREMFSLSPRVKKMLSEQSRHALCRVLSPHVHTALSRWPDNPVDVTIGEDTYKLSESIKSPGKVRVEV